VRMNRFISIHIRWYFVCYKWSATRRIASQSLIIGSGASCATSLPSWLPFRVWEISEREDCCGTSDRFREFHAQAFRNSHRSWEERLRKRSQITLSANECSQAPLHLRVKS